MRRFLTALLALCLLAGCGPQLERFPRVEATAPTYPAQTLTIDIPLGADQFTQDGVAQLAATVLELSGGAVTLEAIPSQNPAAALSNGATHLALLDNRQLLEAVCPKVDKISMIPYRTIDGGGMFLKAVTLDRMEASQGGRLLVYERPLVAASPGKLKMKNGCRVLLHG